MIVGSKSDPLLPLPGRPITVSVMVAYHLVAVLALFPYFFSWTGVALAIASTAVSLFGINIGYHRLLAHRGFTCSKWLERCLAMAGVMALQFGPAYWVALHRRHHQFADKPGDPHSPDDGAFWAHMGWLYVASENSEPQSTLERYAKDLLQDPFYAWLERNGHWGRICLCQWPAVFAIGALAMAIAGGTRAEAVQFGASLVVWGVALRTVYVWFATFAVNSACHLWGYRSHATPDHSRNNLVFGILSCGEGWHNNHHAFPRSVRHGHRWWEFDLAWQVIKGMAAVGLIKILHAWSPGQAEADRSR